MDQLKKAFGFGPKITAEDEIRQFVEGLRSMTDEDMGIILAVATVVRVNLEDQNHLPVGVYANAQLPAPQILMKKMVDLAKVARHFDRLGQTTDAVAAVAVLNTLRCLNTAELRHLGRGIWAELARGTPYVENALAEGERNRDDPFPKRVWKEYKIIPSGLEPGKGASKTSSKIPTSKSEDGNPVKKAATWPKSPPNS
ncbi:MAG: hypothetical protein HOO19_02335 [Rhodospirillaceae bacterium]|jgi:hypothetical protein|nr:hypothetical protein [Rhodospirillaceae bacterium]MBT3886805.1 hypothetical protein [Rhodospirillaceae bacterium]MBT4116505.1 hypothetical protein [Rhodospirillaceae bacterium]MBT4670838.1 hypothetical protein [Rhodospirillaceae bacterium]MBT4720190.1 hypothetical protein [Rhodospirillaceae bacterium]